MLIPLLPETLIGRMEPRKPQLSATCFKESTRVHTKQLFLWLSFVRRCRQNFFRKLFLQFHRLGPALPNDSSKIHSCFSWESGWNWWPCWTAPLFCGCSDSWEVAHLRHCFEATFPFDWVSFRRDRKDSKKLSTSCFYSFIALNSGLSNCKGYKQLAPPTGKLRSFWVVRGCLESWPIEARRQASNVAISCIIRFTTSSLLVGVS